MGRRAPSTLDFTPDEANAAGLWEGCSQGFITEGCEGAYQPTPTGYYPKLRCIACGPPAIGVAIHAITRSNTVVGCGGSWTVTYGYMCNDNPDPNGAGSGSYSVTTTNYLDAEGRCQSATSGGIDNPCGEAGRAWGDWQIGPTVVTAGESEAAMIARAIAGLPDWPEWKDSVGGVSCQASSYLATNSTGAIEESKWRLEHLPSPTCYLKVWLKRTFTPDLGADKGYAPDTDNAEVTRKTYEWNGSVSPCLELNEDGTVKTILSDDTYEAPPESNGTLVIKVEKWSYLSDYEPDIDTDPAHPQPNGFPPDTGAFPQS